MKARAIMENDLTGGCSPSYFLDATSILKKRKVAKIESMRKDPTYIEMLDLLANGHIYTKIDLMEYHHDVIPPDIQQALVQDEAYEVRRETNKWLDLTREQQIAMLGDEGPGCKIWMAYWQKLPEDIAETLSNDEYFEVRRWLVQNRYGVSKKILIKLSQDSDSVVNREANHQLRLL
jgi:hypothetical protein